MAKRCKSLSPSHGFRCELEREHEKSEKVPTHRLGDIVWQETELGRTLTTVGALRDEAAKAGFASPVGHVMSFSFTPQGGIAEDMTDFIRQEAGIQFGEDEEPGPNMPPTKDEIDAAKRRQEADIELRGWWFDLAEQEIDATVPKAIEYSSTDLVDIGRTLAFCMGRDVDEEEAAELGIFFYMQGKMSRWAGAIKTGKRVSDDTLFDIGVYVRMTQRVRDTGGWPGVKLEGK